MKILFTILILFFPCVVEAQTIHGHPQKSSYTNISEWPIISSQCHWNPATTLTDAVTGHTHVDVQAPIYSEINQPLRVPFTIKIFHTDGEVIASLDRQDLVTKIEWDDTNSIVPPKMLGDPTGLKIFTGHITYDPRINHGGYKFPDRGWYSPKFEVLTNFKNGSVTSQFIRLPFYSILNPTALESDLAPVLSSGCYPHSLGVEEWGNNYVELDNLLPLLPINQYWKLLLGAASYGGRNLGDGLFEQRVDLDLHNNIFGRLLSSQKESDFKSTDRAPNLDPIIIGQGSHKMAFIWIKPRLNNKETVSTLLVVDVVVGSIQPPIQVLVPDVIGQSINSALLSLTSAKLTIGSINVVNNNDQIDQVISQNPVSGTSVPQGTAVNLIKSAGPAQTFNWVNITPTFQKFEVPGQPTKYRICEDATATKCKEF